MSYANFIPDVWSAGIERELERLCVFKEDCNTKWEGVVKKCGDSVTIKGVGKPTIRHITKGNRPAKIEEAETVEDTSATMYINQIAYYNYKVDDIDEAQAKDGIMEALSEETSEGLANDVDTYIASMAVDPTVPKLYASPKKVIDHKPSAEEVAAGCVYVLDVLDEVLQKLFENDVNPNTQIIATISPRFYTLFKNAYMHTDTNNSEIIKHGKVAMYGDMVIKRSNNVHKTSSGAVDNIMVRTKRAVAFAQPVTHSEPYRPEREFSDAVKGYILYDAKVVRPKEIYNINVKYA